MWKSGHAVHDTATPRAMARTPGFAGTVILTFGLGIGASEIRQIAGLRLAP